MNCLLLQRLLLSRRSCAVICSLVALYKIVLPENQCKYKSRFCAAHVGGSSYVGGVGRSFTIGEGWACWLAFQGERGNTVGGGHESG